MINVSQYATNLALFFELSVNPQEENPSHLPATASESYPTLSIVSVRVVHTWIYGLTTPLAFWLEKGAGRGRGRIASMFLSTLSRLANFLTRLQTFPALHDCHFAPINVSTRCHDGRGGYIMSELSTRVTETDNDSIDRACHALCISIYIYILILAHSEDNSSSHVNCCDHNVDRGGICRDTETMRRPPRTNVMSSASTTMGHTLLTSCCLSVATQNCISTESGNSCRTTADHHHHPTPTPPHTHIHFFLSFFPIIKRGDRLHQWADDRPNQGPPVTARDLLTRPQHLSPLCLSLSPKLLTAPRLQAHGLRTDCGCHGDLKPFPPPGCGVPCCGGRGLV